MTASDQQQPSSSTGGRASTVARESAAVPRSRTGGLWVAVVLFALVLLLLLIFVLENGQRAEVAFFGMHGHLPQGVALLLAAIFGILLVALPGTVRIVQLRMLGRRRGARTDTRPVTASHRTPERAVQAHAPDHAEQP
jgi:uncharacterized integral membrane protein